jgi:DNA-binding NarL/FixJ family response regulator
MNVLIAHVAPMLHAALRVTVAGIHPGLRVLPGAPVAGPGDAGADVTLAIVGLSEGASAEALGLIRRLRTRTPGAPVVVVADPASEDAHCARDLGVAAVISPADSARAVREIVQTLRPFAAEAVARVPLTPRQAEVLALIAQGKPNKLICRELRLSEGTVKVHVSAVLRAFNVANRTQAVLAAQQRRLHVADRRRCRLG